MARFYSIIQGSRGEATRIGTPQSGIRAQAQGWEVGVKVYGQPMRDGTGADIGDSFDVIATGGSAGYGFRDLIIARVYRGEHDGVIRVEVDPYGDLAKYQVEGQKEEAHV